MKTEQEMREEKVPWPKSEKELIEYIHDQVEREHDYGTCVYAMSHAAVATFNYVSHKLGVTGFQASCADLDILRHTRYLEHGRILDYSNLLYPQYWNSEHFPNVMDLADKEREWLAEEAQKKLDETKDGMAHPEVIKHWKWLVSRK